MRSSYPRILIAGTLLFAGSGRTVADSLTLDTGPEAAWAYSIKTAAGKSNSPSYVPQAADYSDALFLGYILDERLASLPFGAPDEDAIRVFRTFVLSDVDQNVPVVLTGDDGHSLTANGTFIGGGGFGEVVRATIPLHAGVNTIELAIYNGPGTGALLFTRDDGNSSPPFGAPFGTTAGIQMNADGSFAVIPTPTALATAFPVLFTVVFMRTRRQPGR